MQNLLKKHQALQAEISGHEPRIKAVSQKGDAMVDEGKEDHLYDATVQERLLVVSDYIQETGFPG